jgi:hypothetical protein
VHHLQGKAERVNSPELLETLREFHRDKLTLRQRHWAVARHVTHYDFNNTYQYLINREDVHLQWLEAAIAELGGAPHEVGEPDLGAPNKKTGFTAFVETVLPSGDTMHQGKLQDMVMLVVPGGQERTEAEYVTLLEKARFRLTRVVPTDSVVSIVEAIPA